MISTAARLKVIRQLWAVRCGKTPHAIRGHLTAKRGRWYVQKDVCPACGSESINGACKTCGYGLDCAWCGKTRQPDGTWKHIYNRHHKRKRSHGMCPDCVSHYSRQR